MRSPLPNVSRRGKVTMAVVGAALLLLIFLDQFVDLWTDWLWYTEVGYREVFGGLLRTKIWLFLIFGVVVGAIVAGNLYLAFRLRPLLRANSPEQHALERYRMLLSPRIGLWVGAVGAVVGLFAGISGQAHWQQWMLFTNGGPFGIPDPQFGTDVGFYVFDLPFWRYLLDVGFTTTALSILGALAVHYVYGGVRLQGVGDRMTTGARVHLTSLVAFFVLLKAVAYFLDRRALLVGYNSGTDLWGAGYTDINAVLPAKEILTYISVVVAVAILVFSNAGARNLVWAGASLALLGIAAVAIGGIYPAAVQQFTVKPNIRDKEADYIKRTIDSTRQAYGIGSVDRSQYSVQNTVPPVSLAEDRTIIPTVRLLDPAVVNETFAQYQQIRQFYDFPEKLDVDRYTVDGRLQDFVVGVREINYSRLEGQQTNWQNRHTVFTHGYGFVAAPANRICEGAPFFVSGLIQAAPTGEASDSAKCVAPADTIKVNQPRIYFGELAESDDYVVVGKANGAPDPEFDRPAGEGEQQYAYTGEGGVPVSSLFRRTLYALHFREANFLLSDVFNENSKVVYIRNPRERAERVAPFLTFDGDPYPAVVNGRVTWILDGYTTSATYPYSQRVDLQEATSDTQAGTGTVLQARQNINYIRNSVKATVDAYDGTVTLYKFEDDPILEAWNNAFGGELVKPREAVPAELAAHFRYPEDLFKVQRDLLSRFHVSDPRQFNSGQDFWAVPGDPAVSSPNPPKQPPYYMLTQFPGEETTRFQLTAALTPIGRANLSALLTGVLDPGGRMRLELLELPREGRIPGPVQAQQLMANDTEARSQITLLGGQAQVVYGNLLSLPYGDGLLYVQPVYLKSNVENAYPLMRLVLVSYGDQVGFAGTLQGAIQKLLEKAQQNPPPSGEQPEQPEQPTQPGLPSTLSPELAAAIAKIDAAMEKLRTVPPGDFAAYGAALAELDAALREFEAAQAAANGSTNPAPTTTPTPTPS